MVKIKGGLLIAIEGIDGAGKTTQRERLAEALEGMGLVVIQTKEPTTGPWGQKIRESAHSGRFSPEEELAAFIEDRKEHVRDLIKPALARGEVVLIDRYYFSTVAYQGARGLDPKEILERNEEIAPAPDLLILLEVPPRVGVQRVRGRDGEGNLFEREEDLIKSAGIFDEMDFPYLLKVNGTQTPEQVTDEITRHLIHGPLFKRLCAKSSYRATCEPAFCALRDDCQWVAMSKQAEAPVLAKAFHDNLCDAPVTA